MASKLKYSLFVILGIIVACFILVKVFDYLTYKSCYNMPLNEFYNNDICKKYR